MPPRWEGNHTLESDQVVCIVLHCGRGRQRRGELIAGVMRIERVYKAAVCGESKDGSWSGTSQQEKPPPLSSSRMAPLLMYPWPSGIVGGVAARRGLEIVPACSTHPAVRDCSLDNNTGGTWAVGSSNSPTPIGCQGPALTDMCKAPTGDITEQDFETSSSFLEDKRSGSPSIGRQLNVRKNRAVLRTRPKTIPNPDGWHATFACFALARYPGTLSWTWWNRGGRPGRGMPNWQESYGPKPPAKRCNSPPVRTLGGTRITRASIHPAVLLCTPRASKEAGALVRGASGKGYISNKAHTNDLLAGPPPRTKRGMRQSEPGVLRCSVRVTP
ncbi:hypothetical protein Q7P37_008784 [Cladosporium fusiforme]